MSGPRLGALFNNRWPGGNAFFLKSFCPFFGFWKIESITNLGWLRVNWTRSDYLRPIMDNPVFCRFFWAIRVCCPVGTKRRGELTLGQGLVLYMHFSLRIHSCRPVCVLVGISLSAPPGRKNKHRKWITLVVVPMGGFPFTPYFSQPKSRLNSKAYYTRKGKFVYV
jgi:hypothetical protein